MLKKALIIVSLIMVSGCAAKVPMVVIEPVPQLSPIKSTNSQSKKIFVSDLESNLANLEIGQMKMGTGCFGGDELMWNSNPGVINTMGVKVKETFRMNGYSVSSSLLESKAQEEADILIGVAIVNIKANICYSVDGHKGEALVEMNWEVYNKSGGETLTVTSKGVDKVEEFSRTGDPDLFFNAVIMATNNFLANEEIYRLTRK